MPGSAPSTLPACPIASEQVLVVVLVVDGVLVADVHLGRDPGPSRCARPCGRSAASPRRSRRRRRGSCARARATCRRRRTSPWSGRRARSRGRRSRARRSWSATRSPAARATRGRSARRPAGRASRRRRSSRRSCPGPRSTSPARRSSPGSRPAVGVPGPAPSASRVAFEEAATAAVGRAREVGVRELRGLEEHLLHVLARDVHVVGEPARVLRAEHDLHLRGLRRPLRVVHVLVELVAAVGRRIEEGVRAARGEDRVERASPARSGRRPGSGRCRPRPRRFSKAATLTDFQARITLPSAGWAWERSRSQLAA